MSPKPGEEVHLTGLETAILFKLGCMNPKIKEKKVIEILERMASKLKGTYNETTNRN